jgi:flagellin-like protein
MRLKWKNEAVSPVIATILMVAITVVLAAVLYVMVVNMSSGGGAMSPTPVGSWRSMEPTGNTSATLIFGNFQPEVDPIEFRLIIEDENGNIFNLSWTSSILSDNVTLSCDDDNIVAYYSDLNPEGGQVGGGDYIKLYNLEPYTYYFVKLYHYPSDSVINMLGDTSFQTVP